MFARRLLRDSDSGKKYDFYIDAALGNDSNTGSETSPWKTLSKITGISLVVNATVRVLIKQGTYNTALDYVLKTIGGLNSHLYLIFEPNCIMDGTAANALAATNGFEFETSDANSYSTTIYGNGLQINNYNEPTALSPNGVGNRGFHKIYVYNVSCNACGDGFSSHDDAQMFVYDSSSSNSEKGEFLHVDRAYVEHHRCIFNCRTGNNGAGTAGPTIKMFDCIINPPASATTILLGATLERCRVGSLTQRWQLLGGTYTDCYINAYVDGNSAASFTRCYGRLSLRVRSAGGTVVQNCVITAPATGQTAVVFFNFDGGTNTFLNLRNNIFETSTALTFMDITPQAANYLVGAASRFINNVLSPNAAFDPDLIAADTGGTVVVANVSADALIGAGNTLNPNDYGYASGSPAIGAGTGGTNSGFAIGEVAPVAPQQTTYLGL